MVRTEQSNVKNACAEERTFRLIYKRLRSRFLGSSYWLTLWREEPQNPGRLVVFVIVRYKCKGLFSILIILWYPWARNCVYLCLSVCVSVCVYLCLSVYLCVFVSVILCICVCLSVYLCAFLSFYLSVYLCVCLSTSVSICVCVCVYIFPVLTWKWVLITHFFPIPPEILSPLKQSQGLNMVSLDRMNNCWFSFVACNYLKWYNQTTHVIYSYKKNICVIDNLSGTLEEPWLWLSSL